MFMAWAPFARQDSHVGIAAREDARPPGYDACGRASVLASRGLMRKFCRTNFYSFVPRHAGQQSITMPTTFNTHQTRKCGAKG